MPQIAISVQSIVLLNKHIVLILT